MEAASFDICGFLLTLNCAAVIGRCIDSTFHGGFCSLLSAHKSFSGLARGSDSLFFLLQLMVVVLLLLNVCSDADIDRSSIFFHHGERRSDGGGVDVDVGVGVGVGVELRPEVRENLWRGVMRGGVHEKITIRIYGNVYCLCSLLDVKLYHHHQQVNCI